MCDLSHMLTQVVNPRLVFPAYLTRPLGHSREASPLVIQQGLEHFTITETPGSLLPSGRRTIVSAPLSAALATTNDAKDESEW